MVLPDPIGPAMATTAGFTSDHLVRPDPLRYRITRSGQVQVASQGWPSRNRGVFSDDSHDRSRT